MRYIRYIVLLLVVALTGCALFTHKVHFNPTITSTKSTSGNGTVLNVNVVDERPLRGLGRRGTAYGSAAEITTDQDLSEVVKQKLIEGLVNKGFKVAELDKISASPTLVAEIRNLRYATSTGLLTGGVHVDGAIKIIATNKEKRYEKLHRTSLEERVLVVPTAEANETWLNAALSDLLSKIVDDDELIQFLAKNN